MFEHEKELQDEIRQLKAENEKLKLRLSDVSQQRELLLAYENYCDKMSKIYENPRSKILLIDAFLSQ
jgi:uncharacterized protein (DUF3084 family)